MRLLLLPAYLFLTTLLVSCWSEKKEQKEEQIRINDTEISEAGTDSLLNSVQGNSSMQQLPTVPNAVILTGLPEHRLVTVYKEKPEPKAERKSEYSSYSSDYGGEESDRMEHFMPGIDILYGYNLLNIAHYDLKTEKLKYLFNKPALIKTLYYPSFVQDSLDKKPITRNYYMVSVYDQDTNKDTLINKKDLRRLYLFDASSEVKTQLVPSDYSVVRSQYDSKNDVMYIFARKDMNNNGTADKKEPMHIFWILLKTPAPAKRLY